MPVNSRVLNGVDRHDQDTFLMSQVEQPGIENEILSFQIHDEPLFKLGPLIGFLILSFLNCHWSFLLFVLEGGIAVIMLPAFESPAVSFDKLDPVGNELD